MQTLTLAQPATSRLAGHHSPWLSISLHIFPGLLTGAVYYLIAGLVSRLGLPSIVALMAAGLLVIIPFELGVIALAARNNTIERGSFLKMISYRKPLPIWQYLVLTLAIFVPLALIFKLMSPVTNFFQSLFSWLPGSMALNLGQSGSYSRSILIWATIFNALLFGILIPVIEEFYFRGFLLPRMPEGLKGWTPLAHSFLFAVYHSWSPWMIITRTVGLLPLIYGVRRSGNIYVGMIVHCIVNLLDVVTMIAFIATMR